MAFSYSLIMLLSVINNLLDLLKQYVVKKTVCTQIPIMIAYQIKII